ncbi:CDP-diacylglycerol--glycerol-3-phosphate 3-phosphatidyltransferase [Globomyces sp. JEL0801]|nr:CDP-diacylglycerol--glycerol-3-phosphate 3-phosphatidyltransferase [Globomyces sp. JEL0801]
MDLNPFHEFVHSTTLPIFKLNPNQSSIIQSPKDFLTQLKVISLSLIIQLGIQNANNRSGEEELIDLLNTKLSTNSSLKLVILIDYFRGSRLDSNNVSSYTLLSPLVKNFPDQVKIHFYHAPVVSNLVKRIVPPRFIEGINYKRYHIVKSF